MNVQHGQVSIHLDGNIIFVKLVGSVNEFGVKEYTDGVKNIVNSLNREPFTILVGNLEIVGGTPEAYQELEEYNQWLNQQNLVAKEMLITSKSALELIDKLTAKVSKTKVFANERHAIKWLRTLP